MLFRSKEVVMVAVTSGLSSHALQYASDELKNDKEVVMAAVNHYGYNLKYASDELKGDKEVVIAAVTNHKCNLQFASDEMKADKDVLDAAGPEVEEDCGEYVEPSSAFAPSIACTLLSFLFGVIIIALH